MKSFYFTTFVLECTIFYCDIIHCIHVYYTSYFPVQSRDMAKILPLILNTTNQPTTSNFCGYKEQFTHHSLPMQLHVL